MRPERAFPAAPGDGTSIMENIRTAARIILGPDLELSDRELPMAGYLTKKHRHMEAEPMGRKPAKLPPPLTAPGLRRFRKPNGKRTHQAAVAVALLEKPFTT